MPSLGRSFLLPLVLLVLGWQRCGWMPFALSFGQGSQIQANFGLYCNRRASQRFPIHSNVIDCGGLCSPQQDSRGLFTIQVNATQYFRDNVQVVILANPRGGAANNIRGFSVIAVSETDNTVGRFLEQPDAMITSCDPLMEGYSAFHAASSSSRRSVNLTWSPEGRNFGRVRFRAWIVVQYQEIYVLDSAVLQNLISGSEKFPLEDGYYTFVLSVFNISRSAVTILNNNDGNIASRNISTNGSVGRSEASPSPTNITAASSSTNTSEGSRGHDPNNTIEGGPSRVAGPGGTTGTSLMPLVVAPSSSPTGFSPLAPGTPLSTAGLPQSGGSLSSVSRPVGAAPVLTLASFAPALNIATPSSPLTAMLNISASANNSSSNTVAVAVSLTSGHQMRLEIPSFAAFEDSFQKRLFSSAYDVAASDPFEPVRRKVPAFLDLFPTESLPPAGSALTAPFATSSTSAFAQTFSSGQRLALFNSPVVSGPRGGAASSLVAGGRGQAFPGGGQAFGGSGAAGSFPFQSRGGSLGFPNMGDAAIAIQNPFITDAFGPSSFMRNSLNQVDVSSRFSSPLFAGGGGMALDGGTGTAFGGGAGGMAGPQLGFTDVWSMLGRSGQNSVNGGRTFQLQPPQSSGIAWPSTWSQNNVANSFLGLANPGNTFFGQGQAENAFFGQSQTSNAFFGQAGNIFGQQQLAGGNIFAQTSNSFSGRTAFGGNNGGFLQNGQGLQRDAFGNQISQVGFRTQLALPATGSQFSQSNFGQQFNTWLI